MAASDFLKTVRDSPGKEGPAPSASGGDASTSRVIKLTAEEVKALDGTNPGAEVTLEVKGTFEGDHFHVTSLSPDDPEGPPGMEDMAQKVATLVRPQIQISPS